MSTVILSPGCDKEGTCQEGKSTVCALLLPVHQLLCGLSSDLPVTLLLPPTLSVLPSVTGSHWTELLFISSLQEHPYGDGFDHPTQGPWYEI